MPGYLTGNEYVSLSRLSPSDGGVYVASLVSFAHKGLLEFVSDPAKRFPLFLPTIYYKKTRLSLEEAQWEVENSWIPVAHVRTADLIVTLRWVAPPEEKGFALVLDFSPSCSARKFSPSDIEVTLSGCWGAVCHHVNLQKVMHGERRVREACWKNGLLFEFDQHHAVAAFCLSASNSAFRVMYAGNKPAPRSYKELQGVESLAQEVVCAGEEPLYYCLSTQPVACEEGAQLAFFVGYGQEEISAVSGAAHLQRLGTSEIVRRTQARLQELALQVSDPTVSQFVNRNAMFCYYFSTARTFDTEKLCCVTSRSSDYYVSAAYWDRDALFWTFPCVLQLDRSRARELLEYSFTTQLKNTGQHSRFIDGTVMEPGIELDQLCAPVIELVHYLRFTNDFTFARERFVQEAISYLRERLMALKFSSAFLFRSFLSSTDDVPPYSCITYMNVLAWRFFFDLAFIEERLNPSGARSVENRNHALRLRREIYTHCIRRIGQEDVFAYAVPMDGEQVRFDPLNRDQQVQQEIADGLYDDPMGSLVTLPYWGFCKHYDPVYEATIRLLFGEGYRFGNPQSEFNFGGAYHAADIHGPFVASIANRLISRLSQQQIHELIPKLKMDNGLACESINPQTGEAATGAAMASMAGYLAYAAYRGLAKVSGYGMPKPTLEEVAKTEGAIRQAMLASGQPYPRPLHSGQSEPVGAGISMRVARASSTPLAEHSAMGKDEP